MVDLKRLKWIVNNFLIRNAWEERIREVINEPNSFWQVMDDIQINFLSREPQKNFIENQLKLIDEKMREFAHNNFSSNHRLKNFVGEIDFDFSSDTFDYYKKILRYVMEKNDLNSMIIVLWIFREPLHNVWEKHIFNLLEVETGLWRYRVKNPPDGVYKGIFKEVYERERGFNKEEPLLPLFIQHESIYIDYSDEKSLKIIPAFPEFSVNYFLALMDGMPKWVYKECENPKCLSWFIRDHKKSKYCNVKCRKAKHNYNLVNNPEYKDKYKAKKERQNRKYRDFKLCDSH